MRELHVGGRGVGRGYRNRPALQAQKFVPDPFGATPGEALLYKTGDLGRYQPDGTIELVGSGENLEPRLVLHDELAKELAIQPVHVVDGVEQAVALTDAEEERDFSEARLEIDDHRRLLAEAR